MLGPIRYYEIIKFIDTKYIHITSEVITDCCYIQISDMTASFFFTEFWLTLNCIIFDLCYIFLRGTLSTLPVVEIYNVSQKTILFYAVLYTSLI